MKKVIIAIFKYLEHFWCGQDGKPSVYRGLAIAFSIHLMFTINIAVTRWDAGRSVGDLVGLSTIEAGIICGLLGLTSFINVKSKDIEADVIKTTGSANEDIPMLDEGEEAEDIDRARKTKKKMNTLHE